MKHEPQIAHLKKSANCFHFEMPQTASHWLCYVSAYYDWMFASFPRKQGSPLV